MAKKTNHNTLTNREKEIIKLIKKEHSRKMIADVLVISIRTVDTHIKNVHLKTNTHNFVGIANLSIE